MKYILLPFLLLTLIAKGQTTDSVNIPKGVVYKYISPDIIENAKKLIAKELSEKTTSGLNGGLLFIGPVLWSRYLKIPALAAIPNGNMTINFNKEKLTGKMIQDNESFQKIWAQVQQEVTGKEIIIRKATYKELQYYWAVISFDIEEPLLIVQTPEHNYILNLSSQTLKLVWLDEVPASMK